MLRINGLAERIILLKNSELSSLIVRRCCSLRKISGLISISTCTVKSFVWFDEQESAVICEKITDDVLDKERMAINTAFDLGKRK